MRHDHDSDMKYEEKRLVTGCVELQVVLCGSLYGALTDSCASTALPFE
jgi:hypothetical protein